LKLLCPDICWVFLCWDHFENLCIYVCRCKYFHYDLHMYYCLVLIFLFWLFLFWICNVFLICAGFCTSLCTNGKYLYILQSLTKDNKFTKIYINCCLALKYVSCSVIFATLIFLFEVWDSIHCCVFYRIYNKFVV